MTTKQHKVYPSTEKYTSRLYRIWCDMKNRCNNKNAFNYADYGGRGIKTCEEWSKYDNFSDWSNKNGYCKSLTIDRINNDGNYEPSNCRWATPREQARNKRNSLHLTVGRTTRLLIEWADIYGISYPALKERICKHGWSAERALTTPVRKRAHKNYYLQPEVQNG